VVSVFNQEIVKHFLHGEIAKWRDLVKRGKIAVQ
jgi:hypothetical protein